MSLGQRIIRRYSPPPWTGRLSSNGKAVIAVEDAEGQVVAHPWHLSNLRRQIANGRLLTAAPLLAEAGDGLAELIEKMQDTVHRYLTHEISREEAFDLLVYYLEGPEQRSAQKAWHEAVDKVNNGDQTDGIRD